MKPDAVIIRPTRPWAYVVLVVVLVAGALVAVYQARMRFNEALRAERTELATERARLRNATVELREENGALQTELEVSRRERMVERKAREDIEKFLKERQDEVLALRKELEFYRGIVAEPDRPGIEVQTISVTPGTDELAYRFELVLTRNMKSDSVLKGFVSLFVSGSQDGKLRTISLGELKNSTRSPLQFEFKYLQRIEGRMVLPPDFEPRRISVIVRAAGGGRESVEKTLDWKTASS